MTVIYLRSTDGSDASDGLTWANAKATLAGAFAAAGAGGTIYVSDNHAETQASDMTLSSPGTAASPVTVLCVDDAGDPEPPTTLATTATVSTTGATTMNFNGGFTYYYGITFSQATGNVGEDMAIGGSAAPTFIKMEQCGLTLGSTNSGSHLVIGKLGGGGIDNMLIELLNTVIRFGADAQTIDLGSSHIHLVGVTLSAAGSTPTTLFTVGTADSIVNLTIEGCDLTGRTWTNLVSRDAIIAEIRAENCKFPASFVVATGTSPGQGGNIIEIVNCDSADTNYRYYKDTYEGTIAQETTIVRTGGASDGTTAFSRKLASTANSKFYAPLEGPWSRFWNTTVGSTVTCRLEIVNDGTTLENDEVWAEVRYLGTSGFPVESRASNRMSNILSTPAAHPTSSETWTTTGLSSPVKQYLEVAVTPQEVGWIYVRPVVALASKTVYACPKIGVS